MRASMIRSTNGLTRESIQRAVPSAFALTQSPDRSDKYGFIPTVAVIDELIGGGLIPIAAGQTRVRHPDKRDFTYHVIRFREKESQLREVGDIIPEIIVSNSHNGTSAYHLYAGLFRLTCSNGMTVSDGTIESISVRHVGNVAKEALGASLELLEQMPRLVQTVRAWMGHMLTREAQKQYATAAAKLRWEPNANQPNPAQLLGLRRSEDQGNDLWHTFQRVQENISKGSITIYSPGSRRQYRRSRGITSVTTDIKFNRHLWELTEGFAKVG